MEENTCQSWTSGIRYSNPNTSNIGFIQDKHINLISIKITMSLKAYYQQLCYPRLLSINSSWYKDFKIPTIATAGPNQGHPKSQCRSSSRILGLLEFVGFASN